MTIAGLSEVALGNLAIDTTANPSGNEGSSPRYRLNSNAAGSWHLRSL